MEKHFRYILPVDRIYRYKNILNYIDALSIILR